MTIATRVIAAATTILLAGALTACSDSSTSATVSSSSSSSSSNSSSASCQPDPAPAKPSPAIAPPDLPPLPEGAYVVSTTSNGPNSQYVIFVPQTVDAFHQYTLDAWPPAGVVLGGGDRESFEVEVEFSTSSATGNAKARARRCDPKSLDVTIGLTTR